MGLRDDKRSDLSFVLSYALGNAANCSREVLICQQSWAKCHLRQRRTFWPCRPRISQVWQVARSCLNANADMEDYASGLAETGKMDIEQGVILRRDTIQTHTRNGRAARIKRWVNIGDLDLDDDLLGLRDDALESSEDHMSRRVDVWLVVQRVLQDYRVLGRARTLVQRVCDRCMTTFDAECDGRFEVLLVDDDDSSPSSAESRGNVEAVEPFGTGVDQIDLADHVRDAVLLGFPSRALCGAECAGVRFNHSVQGDSVRYAGTTSPATADEGENGIFVNERLMELKRRLES